MWKTVGRAGAMGMQSPLKRYQDSSPSKRDAQYRHLSPHKTRHTHSLSRAHTHTPTYIPRPTTATSTTPPQGPARRVDAQQRGGGGQALPGSVDGSRDMAHTSLISRDRDWTPQHSMNMASHLNAPNRGGGGGVALFGAYHTTGKSLQVR